MKTLLEYIKEELNQINGFCILKPEFLDHEYDFYNLLKNNGWTIIQKQIRTISKTEAEELYIKLKDKDFYNNLCTYMASGDCIACSCYKDTKEPIKEMNKLKERVRKIWGIDDMKNAMHSSDSLENVEREYKLIFENKSII